jgi:hypothetical protein
MRLVRERLLGRLLDKRAISQEDCLLRRVLESRESYRRSGHGGQRRVAAQAALLAEQGRPPPACEILRVAERGGSGRAGKLGLSQAQLFLRARGKRSGCGCAHQMLQESGHALVVLSVDPPLERAMQIRDVLVRAMNKEYSWLRAAEILGVTPRGLRRMRQRTAKPVPPRAGTPPRALVHHVCPSSLAGSAARTSARSSGLPPPPRGPAPPAAAPPTR